MPVVQLAFDLKRNADGKPSVVSGPRSHQGRTAASRRGGGRFLAGGQDLGQCTDDGDLAMVEGAIVYRHACSLGCEGIVSKRLGSPHRSGRADCRLKVKNTAAPAVTREAEEEWNQMACEVCMILAGSVRSIRPPSDFGGSKRGCKPRCCAHAVS